MHETVIERFDSRGLTLRVDRELGVLRGVKVLGLESRNGRSYRPEALRGAIALYEGAKVNVNHPKGHPGAPRDYQDRIGVIRQVEFRPDGLFADLHFNPQHALAGQLAWDAAHAPENVGFSHNVQARVARHGDRQLVEEIARVISVDLVADPATTRGLFESSAAGGATTTNETALATVTLEQLRTARPDLIAELLGEQRSLTEQLEAEVRQWRGADAARTRRALCRRMLAEHQLPDPEAADATSRRVLGEAFLEQLQAAPDEAAVRRLVAERAQLIESARQWTPSPVTISRPVSRPQLWNETNEPPVTDGRSFARAITGG